MTFLSALMVADIKNSPATWAHSGRNGGTHPLDQALISGVNSEEVEEAPCDNQISD